MVALRCLEDLFGSRNECESNIPSTANPKNTVDISRSCADVLLSILKETSISDLRNGPDLLKCDMQPFIVHKRTSMPKCSLERLKDELLEGVHPCTASLIQHSGLMHKDEDNDSLSTDCFQLNVCCRDDHTGTSNSLVTAQEGSTISLPLENGDSHHQNLLPLKRNGDVVDNDIQADLHLNIKRLKCNDSGANEASKHTLSTQFDNEFVEEPFKRMIETREKESSRAERESRVEGLDEEVCSENGHEKFVATNRIVRSANADAINEIEHIQCDNADDATKMPQHIFGDGPCQDIMAGEVNEPEIRNGTSSGRILQKVSVDDSRDNSNCGYQQKSPIDVASSGLFPREIIVNNSEDSAERLYGEDASSDGDEYHHEKVDVAMKKTQFLSYQHTLSHDSLSNGEFLVCNAVNCRMVILKKCLGCSPRFDNKGNFYCPFCTYFYAISKYLEAKARAASAKKELALFIHKDRGRSLGKKHQKLRVEESDGTNVSFDPKFNIDDPLSRDEDILVNEKEGEGGIQKEVVGQRSNDLLEKPVCAVNSDEGKTTNDKTKTKKQYVSPKKYQSITPNRVPWTVEEEQMLKEGVEKISVPGERIPWKQILEYGSSVFWSGRSAMQLKDKWRNMERKS
ncbi:uncharacterized protein [Euphorbia lathyris]